MSDSNFQGLTISIITFGIAVILFFSSIGAIALSNGYSLDDIYNTNQFSNASDIETHLRDYVHAVNDSEQASFQQQATETSEGSVFDIFNSAKTIWYIAKTIPSSVGAILYNSLGIPAWLLLVVIGIILFLGIIYLYLLLRGVLS